jgi:tetratricopeptide (TPR) repeat protein
MVEQRQIAERQRQAGNAAFKQQQYSEALRCYQAGLEVQRHSMALHANAAAAALKLNCYVQALEHCDKVRTCRGWQHVSDEASTTFAGTPCVITTPIDMDVGLLSPSRPFPASLPCLLALPTHLCSDDLFFRSQQRSA